MASVVLSEFEPRYTDALVALWRESFEFGVGIVDPHPLHEQREHFLRKVVPEFDLRVALQDGVLVGFVAASPQSVSQLYVHVTHLGQGIGGRLLEWAKRNSDGTLWLYTFARNQRARRFYERNGFSAVASGFEPTWKLEDVRYEWRREPGAN